jgi:hypothetical protein
MEAIGNAILLEASVPGIGQRAVTDANSEPSSRRLIQAGVRQHTAAFFSLGCGYDQTLDASDSRRPLSADSSMAAIIR